MELPLLLEEWLQMLCERCREALYTQPFGKSGLEHEEVSSLAGIESAIHVGCNENVEVWWQRQLFKGVGVAGSRRMVLRCEQAHGRSLGSGGVFKVASQVR